MEIKKISSYDYALLNKLREIQDALQIELSYINISILELENKKEEKKLLYQWREILKNFSSLFNNSYEQLLKNYNLDFFSDEVRPIDNKIDIGKEDRKIMILVENIDAFQSWGLSSELGNITKSVCEDLGVEYNFDLDRLKKTKRSIMIQMMEFRGSQILELYPKQISISIKRKIDLKK